MSWNCWILLRRLVSHKINCISTHSALFLQCVEHYITCLSVTVSTPNFCHYRYANMYSLKTVLAQVQFDTLMAILSRRILNAICYMHLHVLQSTTAICCIASWRWGYVKQCGIIVSLIRLRQIRTYYYYCIWAIDLVWSAYIVDRDSDYRGQYHTYSLELSRLF